MWSLKTLECLRTQRGHTSTVRSLRMSGGIAVSRSQDNSIRVWDLSAEPELECVGVLIGHTGAIRCLEFDGHRIVSGLYNQTVKVWDLNELRRLPAGRGGGRPALPALARGPQRQGVLVVYDGRIICSGSLDHNVIVWGVDGTLIHTLMGHDKCTGHM